MARLLALLLALTIAAGALYLLARGSAEHAPVAPPLDHIDEGSRARLERVLREADREEGRR